MGAKSRQLGSEKWGGMPTKRLGKAKIDVYPKSCKCLRVENTQPNTANNTSMQRHCQESRRATGPALQTWLMQRLCASTSGQLHTPQQAQQPSTALGWLFYHCTAVLQPLGPSWHANAYRQQDAANWSETTTPKRLSHCARHNTAVASTTPWLPNPQSRASLPPHTADNQQEQSQQSGSSN